MLWIIRDALEMLQPRAEILRLRLVHCFVGEVFFQALKNNIVYLVHYVDTYRIKLYWIGWSSRRKRRG